MKRWIVGLAVAVLCGRAYGTIYTLTDLGDLPGGENASAAFAINNMGQIVGRSEAASGRRAFLWQSGVMTDLGVLTPGDEYSIAYDINDAGDVVGQSVNRPFLYSGGTMTDIGTLGLISETGYSGHQRGGLFQSYSGRTEKIRRKVLRSRHLRIYRSRIFLDLLL